MPAPSYAPLQIQTTRPFREGPPARSVSLADLQTSQNWTSKPTARLASGIPALDTFLQGGLPTGSLIEWGMPFGQGTRELLMPWLARLSRRQDPCWLLWIHGPDALEVYPPAWAARGIELSRLRFARTQAPLRDLKPVFLEPLFKLIVIDSPEDFSDDDCAFVARQCRRLGLTTLLLRDQLLSPTPPQSRRQSSHFWAKMRLNTWRHPLFPLYTPSPSHIASITDSLSAPTPEARGSDTSDAPSCNGEPSAMPPYQSTLYHGLWVEAIRGLTGGRILLTA